MQGNSHRIRIASQRLASQLYRAQFYHLQRFRGTPSRNLLPACSLGLPSTQKQHFWRTSAHIHTCCLKPSHIPNNNFLPKGYLSRVTRQYEYENFISMHHRYLSTQCTFWAMCFSNSHTDVSKRYLGIASQIGRQPQAAKSSDAWVERPVVFRATTTPATKQKSEKSTKKVTKIPRPRTKKPSRLIKREEKDAYLCTAFSTAEEYNLEHLSYDLQIQGNKFCLADMPEDAHDVLHVQLSDDFYERNAVDEPGEMFFFREGSVIYWNVPDPVIKEVMRIVGRHQHDPYEIALVNWENEQMNYSYDEQNARIVKGNIVLDATRTTEETALEKFAFSNAMALSVKLAIWEYSLDKFVSSIENIPESMKLGQGVKLSRQEVMKKTGELFALRHRINLSSDLLISPDFYWDREELEMIYSRMCQFLSITRRTNVMNEKLNHCSELVELMRTHLDEKHSHRLEWMIIALIMVEVLFEIIHYIRLYHIEDETGTAASSR